MRSRWSGSVPASRLLFNDMIVIGTTVNIVAALLGLILLARDAPAAIAAAVYFAPLPYNLFLFAALWKRTAGTDKPFAALARFVGAVWLLVTLLL